MSWKKASTRFILVWKKIENLLDSMWASCSTWEWEDAIGSLSIAQSEKTPTKKRGEEEKKKKITWSWEPSHIMNNLPRNSKKKTLFLQ